MSTFGDELADALPEMREMAESRMRDRCVVERRTGRKTQNKSTGVEEVEWVTRFESKCRVKDMGYADSAANVGGRRDPVGTTQIHLPWNVEKPRVNERIRITAVSATTAPRHVGKAYYVGTDHDNSDQTATRLVVKEDPWPSA